MFNKLQLLTNMIDERVRLIAKLRKMCASMRPPRLHGGEPFMELDLTIPQLKVLFLISAGKRVRMSEIAGELNVSLSAGTYIVDRLVKAGYVARGEDPQDRRVVECFVTRQGKSLMGRLRDAGPFGNEELLSKLSVDELKVIVRAFEIFRRATEELRAEQAVQKPGRGEQLE